MPLVLQLHLVMMSKYSNVGLIPLIHFVKWATLKFLQYDDEKDNDDNNNNDLAITKAQLYEDV